MFWYDASLPHLPSPIINLPVCQWPRRLPPPFTRLSLSLCIRTLTLFSTLWAVIWHRAAAGCHLCNSVQSLSNPKSWRDYCTVAKQHKSTLLMFTRPNRSNTMGANLHFNNIIYIAKVVHESKDLQPISALSQDGEHSSCQRQTHILDGSIEAVIRFRWLVIVTYHSLCFHQASRNAGWRICFSYSSFFSNERRFLCLNRCRLLTDSKSNVKRVNAARQCDRLHTESVAMLTVNIPVKSDICFQSSPLGSLQQFPWKPHCHFPPLFGPLDILKAFFVFSLGLLKLARPSVNQRIRVCLFLASLCICASGCVHV